MKKAINDKVTDRNKSWCTFAINKDENPDDDSVAMLYEKTLKVINENIIEIQPPKTEIIISSTLAIFGFAFLGLLSFPVYEIIVAFLGLLPFPVYEIIVIIISIGLQLFSVIMCNVLGETKLVFNKKEGTITEFRPNHLYTKLFRSNIRRVFKLSEIEAVKLNSFVVNKKFIINKNDRVIEDMMFGGSVNKFRKDDGVIEYQYMNYRVQLIISGKTIPILDSSNKEKVEKAQESLMNFLYDD